MFEFTPTLQTAVLRLGQRLLDAGFSANPETLRGLSELQGTIIGVEITDFARQLFFVPRADGIDLKFSVDRDPDTWIKSDFVNLIRARQAKPGDGVQLEVSGDVSAGQALQDLLRAIDFDWEEWLANYVGDIAAHRIGGVVRETGQWLRRTADSLAFSAGEYLREEIKTAADARQVEQFIAEVDRLRDDVERLAVRIERLG